MKKSVIVGIGVVTLDWVQMVRRYPEEGTTQQLEAVRRVIGGPVGRGVLTCHRLGQPCEIVGMIGKGKMADTLRGMLVDEGVVHRLTRFHSCRAGWLQCLASGQVISRCSC